MKKLLLLFCLCAFPVLAQTGNCNNQVTRYCTDSQTISTSGAGLFNIDHRWADVYGNFVAVRGNYNNTVIYRLSDGVRTCAFYGRVLGGDGAQGLVAVANRDQELIVYDTATGTEIKRVILDHQPRVARFVPSQHALLVLTATQRVYTIPIPSAAAGVAASSN